ncbi:MAG: hypothetical protein OXG27_06450 [Chloroflexi bacterium]|nr:hypothetical protein [Chloroflexota bacterium]
MSTGEWNRINTRSCVGATLTVIGAAALYNAMWFMLVPPSMEETAALGFQVLLWFWPMSAIVTLLGLLTLPPSRGRTISWSCFVVFVLATGIHAVVRGLYLEYELVW